MNLLLKSGSSAAVGSRRIRVMIADDAVVVRGLFARWIDAEPDLQVVATVRTGREALDRLAHADPDVVVLDVDMPELDGLAALPLLLQKKRDLTIIMASTLTRRNAEVSLKALSLGATDYIPKPQTAVAIDPTSSFRRELIEKIRVLANRRKRTAADPPLAQPGEQSALPKIGRAPPLVPQQPVQKLRAFPGVVPRVLVIGASTGGPQALTGLMKELRGVIDDFPVLITQHMPPTFTTILAEHIARVSGKPAREAMDGHEINSGNIYLAPGGKHMTVARRDGIAVTEVTDDPPINFCKPAVDPMFASAASVWGQWVLGLVLTGMGADGLQGSKRIVAGGGAVIAQDEATSVIWGMPGQVAQAGLASAILPLDQIAATITRLFAGEKP
jgi:two-component system chemotaxis response regulator CheB